VAGTDDQLNVDREEMRRTGYATVDLLVELLATPSDDAVMRRASPDEMERRLDRSPPEDAVAFDDVLGELNEHVLPFMSRGDHPRYFAFIPGNGTWPGALGDFVASAMNLYAGCWMEGAGPTQLELTVLNWFKEWVGYPREAGGILVSGGSAANMTALACARETLLGAMAPDVVAYVSDQSHSSVARAARALGFRPEQVRVIPAGRDLRLRPDLLDEAMAADLEAGRRPLFVSASAGSTNTGAIDDLDALATVARARGAWFHVDAAYGGFAALTDRGRAMLAGIERADSITLDPHKWLYQPFECGCLLVRERRHLREAFEVSPDYLADTHVASGEVNFSDLGLQLTRMSRAVKVWTSLRTFGVGAFRATIDRCLDLAIAAQTRIEESPDLELLLPAQLGIVCFRRTADGADEATLERMNAVLLEKLALSGYGLISSTRLHGRYALRLCILNHTSTEAAVHGVLDWLANAEVDLDDDTAPTRLVAERNPDMVDGWATRDGVAAADIAALELFRGLTPAERDMLSGAVRELNVATGEAVIREWDAAREFYVILDGATDVVRNGEVIRHLESGDHFGELGALEWGSSFSYPRLASIVATEPSRLLVVPGAVLNALVRSSSAFAQKIRASIHERLPNT
jgi:glutamate/tyrosine decarboxylase-like PLP-dependent enzyme